MKKLGLMTLSLTCTLVLSACSSSSGGGGGSNPRFLSEKPAESTNTNNTAAGTVISTPTTNSESDTGIMTGSETGSDTGTGSGSNSATTTETGSSSVAQSNVLKGSLFQKESESRLTGAIVAVDKSNNVSASNIVSGAKANLEELVVNGATIQLRTQAADDEQSGFNPVVSKDVTSGNLGSITGAVNKTSLYDSDTRYYQFVRFGVINTATTSHLFVQGLQTPVSGISYGTDNGYQDLYRMPTSGKVQYRKGEALYGHSGTYESLNADVIADFDKKLVSVSLKDNAQAEKIAFTSDISGNTFSGTNNGIESKGAFYGSQANQIGGVFYDTNTNKNGVFGATDKRYVSE